MQVAEEDVAELGVVLVLVTGQGGLGVAVVHVQAIAIVVVVVVVAAGGCIQQDGADGGGLVFGAGADIGLGGLDIPIVDELAQADVAIAVRSGVTAGELLFEVVGVQGHTDTDLLQLAGAADPAGLLTGLGEGWQQHAGEDGDDGDDDEELDQGEGLVFLHLAISLSGGCVRPVGHIWDLKTCCACFLASVLLVGPSYSWNWLYCTKGHLDAQGFFRGFFGRMPFFFPETR